MTLTEKAERYYNELPPHAKLRKGGFYIKELINSIREAEEEIRLIKDKNENLYNMIRKYHEKI